MLKPRAKEAFTTIAVEAAVTNYEALRLDCQPGPRSPSRLPPFGGTLHSAERLHSTLVPPLSLPLGGCARVVGLLRYPSGPSFCCPALCAAIVAL